MRKWLTVLLAVGILGLMFTPMLTMAQETIPEDCAPIRNAARIQELTGESAVPDNGLHCLLDTLITIQQWIFYFFLVIALIMILVGAFQFVTAGGSEEQTANARRTLIYALIGIAVAFLARILLSLAQNMVAG